MSTSMLKRGLTGLAMAVALATTAAGTAFAHPEGETDGGTHVGNKQRDARQHGENVGHLPGSNSGNIDVVSKLKLKNVVPEKIADVGVYKNYAYLAAWGVVTCKYNGVHVVDIKDVANPKEVAFIGAKTAATPVRASRQSASARQSSPATSWSPTTRNVTPSPASAA